MRSTLAPRPPTARRTSSPWRRSPAPRTASRPRPPPPSSSPGPHQTTSRLHARNFFLKKTVTLLLMLSNPDVKIYRKEKKRMSRQRLAACVPHMCTVRNMRRNDTKANARHDDQQTTRGVVSCSAVLCCSSNDTMILTGVLSRTRCCSAPDAYQLSRLSGAARIPIRAHVRCLKTPSTLHYPNVDSHTREVLASP
jgi:hypothetical protein